MYDIRSEQSVRYIHIVGTPNMRSTIHQRRDCLLWEMDFLLGYHAQVL